MAEDGNVADEIPEVCVELYITSCMHSAYKYTNIIIGHCLFKSA